MSRERERASGMSRERERASGRSRERERASGMSRERERASGMSRERERASGMSRERERASGMSRERERASGRSRERERVRQEPRARASVRQEPRARASGAHGSDRFSARRSTSHGRRLLFPQIWGDRDPPRFRHVAWKNGDSSARMARSIPRARASDRGFSRLRQRRAVIRAAIDDDVGDDLLRLVLMTCHPVLSPGARVALALRLLGGLTTAQIARLSVERDNPAGYLAASISARNSRACSARSRMFSGCHCTPTTKRGPGASSASITPSGAKATGRMSPAGRAGSSAW